MPNLFDHITKRYSVSSPDKSCLHLITTDNAIEKFELWLSQQNICRQSQKRLLYIFIELAQNISKHCSDTKNLMISVQKNNNNQFAQYQLNFLNEINEIDQTRIITEFSIIEKLNPAEIKQTIKQRIQSNGKGTGLLSIKQKSDDGPEYHIIPWQNKTYLLIKTGIHV